MLQNSHTRWNTLIMAAVQCSHVKLSSSCYSCGCSLTHETHPRKNTRWQQLTINHQCRSDTSTTTFRFGAFWDKMEIASSLLCLSGCCLAILCDVACSCSRYHIFPTTLKDVLERQWCFGRLFTSTVVRVTVRSQSFLTEQWNVAKRWILYLYCLYICLFKV